MVLKELCALRGVSGFEGDVRADLLRRLEGRADSLCVDRMGSVLARKKASGAQPQSAPTVLLSAHMDEPGFLIIGIDEDGLLAFRPIGRLDARAMVSKRVRIGEMAVRGVIGAKAIHLQTDEELAQALDFTRLYIDIGAKNREDALKAVKPGDYVSIDSEWVEFGDGRVKSRSLEARIGCMLLLSLIEERFPLNLVCAFTVQHETGFSGAECAAYSEHPDAVLALDTVPACDLGNRDGQMDFCRLGQGAVICFQDEGSAASPQLYKLLHACARRVEIPVQPFRGVAGRGSAGKYQYGFSATPVAGVLTPVRYSHSCAPVAAFCDIEAQYRLLTELLEAPELAEFAAGIMEERR